jgi:pimeloyl-ACP methyl ester carboxylesterase
MQRPVMNPAFFEESTAPKRRRRPLRAIGAALLKVLRKVLRLLTFDPLHRIKGFRAEEGTATSRFVRALMYRLAFVPVLIAAVSCAIVWVGTHPRSVVSEIDPAAQGIYYDPVTFVGADQTGIDGWLVPVLDAKTVLEEKEQALRKKHPAVVLLHDIGQRREQLLPLIKPLHDAGYVVLAINLRGGTTRAARGETFGLTESGDAKAAVELLRRRPFVDAKRIALVGCGTGATAALLAADADAQIAAVVADRPIHDEQELVKSRLLPKHVALRWLAPLCKWTFELSYGVNAEDLALSNFKKLFNSRPVLLIDDTTGYADPSDPKTIEQVKVFLGASLAKKDAVAGVEGK